MSTGSLALTPCYCKDVAKHSGPTLVLGLQTMTDVFLFHCKRTADGGPGGWNTFNQVEKQNIGELFSPSNASDYTHFSCCADLKCYWDYSLEEVGCRWSS